MSEPTSERSPDELIRNIQKLMDEVESIVAKTEANVPSAVERALDQLEDRLSTARYKVKGAYHATRQKVTAGAQVADEAIRGHPYESVALALGVGVLLGTCLRRNGSSHGNGL